MEFWTIAFAVPNNPEYTKQYIIIRLLVLYLRCSLSYTVFLSLIINLNCAILAPLSETPIIWNLDYVIHRLSAMLSIEAKVDPSDLVPTKALIWILSAVQSLQIKLVSVNCL